MDKLITAVTRRVNPGGQKEVTIRKYGAEEIEIIVPEVNEVEVARIERIISTTGSLEFRILANQRNDKELIERALAEPSKREIRDGQGNLLAWWLPVKEGEEKSFPYSRDRHPQTEGRPAGNHGNSRRKGHLQRHRHLSDAGRGGHRPQGTALRQFHVQRRRRTTVRRVDQ